MDAPNNNRTILMIGAGLAVLAAIVLALVFSGSGGDRTPKTTPADRGDLTVDVADAPSLEPTRQLRCFVDGQFIGMATLADCAQRNGVATNALDVGLDETGALAAAPTAAFAPPPVAPPAEMIELEPAPTPSQASQPSQPSQPVQPNNAACLRYVGSEWRAVPGPANISACVNALFSGQCVRPGDAQYGRFGDTTLRLVPRRVEQSSDNNRFRTLTTQDRDCQFPDLGR